MERGKEMLREETEFIHNAIGVDPSGCGCTDCIVGNSMPEDSYDIEELVRAHFEEGRRVVNRTSGTIVMYKTGPGKYKMDVVGSREINIMEETRSWNDPEDYDYVLHASYCVCNSCERSETIPVSDESRADLALRAHYNDGETVYNGTGYTLLTFQNWDESYKVEEIDLPYEDSSISIITYN
jgi:hypothetical protein